MHDIVIRGGTIVDGTGAAPFGGDLAIDGDRIAQVGGKAGPGRREMKADGRLVTPGWVDIHTHYDGQATWDPVLAPSSVARRDHAVCSAIAASASPPCAAQRPRQALIDLMEGVEDIPGIVLTEGMKWDWESFPEYLDALARLPRAIDVGTQLAAPPLARLRHGRARACGREAATPDDIAADAGAGRSRRWPPAPSASPPGARTAQDHQRRAGAGPPRRGRGAAGHRRGRCAGPGAARFGMLTRLRR